MRIETLMLILSFVLCVTTFVTGLLSKDAVQTRKMSCICFSIITGLLLADVLLMIHYQLQSNFMFDYVYSHTSKSLKGIYRISALWAGQEGSFLLWACIMAIMGLFVTGIKNEKSGRIIAFYSLLCGVVILLTLRSNPFRLTGLDAADGRGLNEALQNPWMAVHPPLVFISYSAMAVLMSLSAGISKHCKSENDINTVRFWIRVSFLFLSTGIFSGSVWAYRALGWGGYWAWDPIENAAFVPWLVLCVYLHCKSGTSRLACIIPFTLAAFGTFLARSGILKDKSVHAYAGGSDSLFTFIIFSLFILFAIVVAFIGVKTRKKEHKNRKACIDFLLKPLELFKIGTLLYATLIFIGTIFPLFSNIPVPIGYYNIISIIYVISMILLFTAWYIEVLLIKSIPVFVLNTVLLMLITFTLRIESYGWLLLLWCCFIQAWILLFAIKLKNLYHTVLHFAVILLFAGAIASSALSADKVAITDGNTLFHNQKVSMEELQTKGSIILFTPGQDIILKGEGVTAIDRKTMLIPYTTKPLIILFWAGGCLVMLCLVFVLIRQRVSKSF